MAKPKVVLTRRWPKACEDRASELFDAKINRDDKPMSVAELQDALRSIDALFPTVTDKITAEVLGVSPRQTKLIGNFGVGFNNIDVEAAKKHGLVVTNTPDVLTDCTADIAMTLLLMTARRAGEGERHLRNKQWTGWRPTHMLGHKVTGKTLGVLGFGRIGRAVAHRAHHGFGMKIIFNDPFPPSDADIKAVGGEKRESVEAVLREADFVTLHCPAMPETRHLMNAKTFGQMKPGAILINTARGDVVDEAALVAALQAGTIAGAGLDVFEREPQVTEALLGMENVVLLPHLGSATMETRVAMGMKVIDNAQAFFAGKAPPNRVA
ncbi:MAG: D-glycerate dehydrogenase [Alphaproteobacteria bacterium]